MVDNVKVKITEKNGVELEFDEEYELIASNVPFDNTNTEFLSDTVQDAIVEGGTRPIQALTEFESFSSPAPQSTTSNGWVTKSGYPFTTTNKTSGTYVVDFTATLSQNSNNSEAGYRIQYRIGTTGTWIDLFSIIIVFARAGTIPPITSFREVTLPSDGVFQLRVQWGQTNQGGSATLSEANLKIGKASA